MTTSRIRPLRSAGVAMCCAVAMATTACTITVGTDSTTATTTTPPAAAPSAAPQTTGVPGVTEPSVDSSAAQRLCSDIGAQLSNWQIQGPTLGRGGFNLVVQSWAAATGGINLGVVANRSIVDEVTQANCPDIRSQAMELLAIPDLASGLVGL